MTSLEESQQFQGRKDRHGIRALSIQSESLSAAAQTVEPFKAKLSRKKLISQVFVTKQCLIGSACPIRHLCHHEKRKLTVLRSLKIE